MMQDCPPKLLSQYAAYDSAFSNRDVSGLRSIETSDFRDTDPDGTVRDLAGASENQNSFFAIAAHLHLRSSVRCRVERDNRIVTIATMSLTGYYTPPKSHTHHFSQVYVNHDVWRNIDGRWRLASQTTVKVDGVDDGKPIHQRLHRTGYTAAAPAVCAAPCA